MSEQRRITIPSSREIRSRLICFSGGERVYSWQIRSNIEFLKRFKVDSEQPALNLWRASGYSRSSLFSPFASTPVGALPGAGAELSLFYSGISRQSHGDNDKGTTCAFSLALLLEVTGPVAAAPATG